MAGLEFGAKLYVAPANPAGRALAESLAKEGYRVLGFVDNFKKAEGIINNAGSAKNHDYLVVADGYHQNDICEGLIARGFDRAKLMLQMGDSIAFRSFRWNFSKLIISAFRRVWQNCLIGFSNILTRKLTVYYAENFVDTNILLTWRAHVKKYPHEALLVAKNIDSDYAEKILGKENAVVNRRWWEVWCLLRARVIVIDHEYVSEWFTAARKKRPVIQLWHGLPYKALAGNSHYPGVEDQAFISSSKWFNQNVFKKIFNARYYLDFGYPRCDALLQPPEKRDWVGSVSHNQQKALLKNVGPLWIYMPTYRDNGNDEIPINFSELDDLFRKNKRVLIVKFHPSLQKKFSTVGKCNSNYELVPLKNCSNIYIYPALLNIYTWLADAEGLITDYSSIAYDFSILSRPTIYFQYDRKAYETIRGDFWCSNNGFDYENYVSNQDELFLSLCEAMQNDKKKYIIENNGICSDISEQESIPKVIDYLRNL